MKYFKILNAIGIVDTILKTLKPMATCMRLPEPTVRSAKNVAENTITGII